MGELLDNYEVIERGKLANKANKSIVEKWLSLVEKLVFPKFCGGCGARDTWLCGECERQLKFVETTSCVVCGKPSLLGRTHFECLNDTSPQKFIGIFKYQPPFSKILQRVKYGQHAFALLNPMLTIAIDELKERGVEFGKEALVVPVPLHWQKVMKRGFNVPDIIAKAIGDEYNLTLSTGVLKRIRKTSTQTKLTKSERRRNVAGAFAVNSSSKRLLVDKDILLVDDVCTTGATLTEAAKVLKMAGCDQVWCLALAKD